MVKEEVSEIEIPKHQNSEELAKFIDSLVNQPQTYNTCVYSMSAASFAAFEYVADKLGVTGFQASCADLDFLKRTRRLKDGFRLIDYKKLLYPQYYYSSDDFPTAKQLLMKNLDQLQKRAQEFIEENDARDAKIRAHPDVRKHWEWIVNLKLIP